MVNKLRNKFVITTSILLLVVFGGFVSITSIYNNYWNSIEIVGTLEWIAYSGVFSEEGNQTSEQYIMDMTYDENPIIGIHLDYEGNVIEKQTIGLSKTSEISPKVLEKMCELKDSRCKIGRYYYAYTEPSDNRVLLVIMDTTKNKNEITRLIGKGGLILLGIGALLVIISFLSRFVTKPAQQSLLREKRFISDASHELKTPLGAISINAQALAYEDNNNLYLKNIISEAGRMNRLIEKLLILSKYDEQENVSVSNIQLSDICEEMALTYECIAYEKKIEYEYDIAENIAIKGNDDEIRQLIAVLLDNAIKNTDEKGRIEISLKSRKGHCVLTVSNTGRGIDPDDIPHVFERFYTSDKARDKGSFGLGLSIAKAIVDIHNGTIEVHSTRYEKTVFEVVI